MSVIRLFAAMAVLLPFHQAVAQTDRAEALLVAISHILHRNPAICSRVACAPVGLLVSAADSANLEAAASIVVIPITPASLNKVQGVRRVLSVQELRLTNDALFIRIDDLVDNETPTPWMTPLMRQPLAPGTRFHRAGHDWEIQCVRRANTWTVSSVVESIV